MKVIATLPPRETRNALLFPSAHLWCQVSRLMVVVHQSEGLFSPGAHVCKSMSSGLSHTKIMSPL